MLKIKQIFIKKSGINGFEWFPQRDDAIVGEHAGVLRDRCANVCLLMSVSAWRKTLAEDYRQVAIVGDAG